MKRAALLAFALSGAAALIYEISWIRPLQFIFGSTIHSISIIFSAFMGGLALGSFVMSRYADRVSNPAVLYSVIELAIGAYGIMILSVFGLVPGLAGPAGFMGTAFSTFVVTEFVVVFLLLLIPTALMGATFPLIARVLGSKNPGRAVGSVYSANNAGAIAGSIAAGLVLIPVLGIYGSVFVAAVINLAAGAVVLMTYSRHLCARILPAAVLVFIALAFMTSYDIHRLHGPGFYRTSDIGSDDIVFYKEGLHSTVSVVSEGNVLALLINGKGQGSTLASDARVNFLLAYLPLLLNENSQDSMVIGLGTGTTSGILSRHVPTTTVEIEPAVAEAATHFWFMNFNVLNSSNHELIIGDARKYLASTESEFDVISTEPSDPWQSFSTNLYSSEFFELVGRRLSDDGLFVQWVPIYTMNPADFQSLYRTFSKSFPNSIAFTNIAKGEGPEGLLTTEIILVGSRSDIRLEKILSNFQNLEDTDLNYLEGIRIESAQDMFDLVLFTSDEMQGYADSATMVTDDNCLLEFSTSRAVLNQAPMAVIDDIEAHLAEDNGGFDANH